MLSLRGEYGSFLTGETWGNPTKNYRGLNELGNSSLMGADTDMDLGCMSGVSYDLCLLRPSAGRLVGIAKDLFQDEKLEVIL